tara:strand:- start:4129 stop:4464 length:336 start_codon:yes stop_codon:yes gene_type:complete
MAKLMRKAQEWAEWHGSWLEYSLNEYFDTFSVKHIKRKALAYILEDNVTMDEISYLFFFEAFRDWLKIKAKREMYDNPDAVPTPATIDTMFELEIPIVGEMYETFCEHYGI